MYKALVLVICVFSIGLLSSCSGTHTLGTWEKAGLQPKNYSKIVVYTNAQTIAARATLERNVAKSFAKKKMDAVAASDAVPLMKIDSIINISQIQSTLSTVKADLFLVVVVGRASHSFKQSGENSVTPTTVTKCESRLFHVESGELIMTVDTESEISRETGLGIEGYENYEDLANELGSELVGKFKNKAIVY